MTTRPPLDPIVAALAAVAALLAVPGAMRAQDTTAHRLPPVTVTRDVGRSPLDLPYAISSVRPDSLAPGQTHTLVEQTLGLLPGVTIANRTNPSQDTRLSIRGFGARSQFGARSIRLLRDGMPLTLPDGQTPIDYLDLESVGRVEVIRGSASSLYGNASGGVIDLRTIEPPDTPFSVQGRSVSGSNNLQRFVGLFGGTDGPVGFEGNIGHTANDGYRAYAQQRLTNAFLHGAANIGATELTLTGLGLDMPVAQNPGALTLAQADSAPEMADPLSVSKKARKAVHQVQLGLSARHPLGAAGEVVGQVYGGTRSLYNPLTYAIVGVGRHQSGAGLRLTEPFTLAGLTNRLSVGVDAQWLNDARKNWANCNGLAKATAACPVINVDEGALSLDQRELVTSVGPYLRDEVDVGRLRTTLGIRADQVRFQLRDAYLADGRDDSGERTMHAVSPMAGVAFRTSSFNSVYADVGTAFETPTTTELGNQSDGSAGLNRQLQPQTSVSYETGTRGLAVGRVQYDVALFDIEVRDELIPFETPDGAGRTFYRNAGRTRRAGLETELSTEVGPLVFTTAYAWSHFRFRDFLSGGTQAAGNLIPGIPEHQIQADATWKIGHAFVVAEGQAKSRVYVNDLNAAAAPGFAVFNLRVGGTAVFGRPWLSPVVAVQNLFDRRYIGSVAVNAAGPTLAGTKFYEPAPRRSWYLGLSAATSPW